MIWATVSSRSYFCWLIEVSIFSCKECNQSNFSIDQLVMSMWVISWVVGKGCLLWPAFSLYKTLLAFATLHFVLQCQTCLLFWLSLGFLLFHFNGNPLQYSCLENLMDAGAWWAAVYGVAQSWTWLKRLSSSSSSLWWKRHLFHVLVLDGFVGILIIRTDQHHLLGHQ